jgi:hypothetical protein
VLERASNRDPSALGSVDAADDENSRPPRIADADRDDRPPALRTAEQDGA